MLLIIDWCRTFAESVVSISKSEMNHTFALSLDIGLRDVASAATLSTLKGLIFAGINFLGDYFSRGFIFANGKFRISRGFIFANFQKLDFSRGFIFADHKFCVSMGFIFANLPKPSHFAKSRFCLIHDSWMSNCGQVFYTLISFLFPPPLPAPPMKQHVYTHL